MRKISPFLVAFLILTVIFMLVGVFVLNRPVHRVLSQNPPQYLTGMVVPVDDPESNADACGYAVVCGGIHDISQLHKVIANDLLAASLYAGFDFRTAKVITLQNDVWAYVAYRRDGHIFYTHTKRRIRAGESVLEDGAGTMILTRCGNRLLTNADEAVPQEAAEPLGIYPPQNFDPTSEPIADNLTTPLYAFLPPAPGPPSQSPPVYTAIPPVYYPPPCCVVGTSPKPPVNVPEPSSFLLLTVGLVALGFVRFVREKTMKRTAVLVLVGLCASATFAGPRPKKNGDVIRARHLSAPHVALRVGSKALNRVYIATDHTVNLPVYLDNQPDTIKSHGIFQ